MGLHTLIDLEHLRCACSTPLEFAHNTVKPTLDSLVLSCTAVVLGRSVKSSAEAREAIRVAASVAASAARRVHSPTRGRGRGGGCDDACCDALEFLLVAGYVMR